MAAHGVSFWIAREQRACVILVLPKFPCFRNRTTVKNFMGGISGGRGNLIRLNSTKTSER